MLMIDICYGAVAELKAAGMAIILVEQSTQRALDVTVLESGREVWKGNTRQARESSEMIDALLGLRQA